MYNIFVFISNYAHFVYKYSTSFTVLCNILNMLCLDMVLAVNTSYDCLFR